MGKNFRIIARVEDGLLEYCNTDSAIRFVLTLIQLRLRGKLKRASVYFNNH